MSGKNRFRLLWLLAVFVTVLDQVTKILVLKNIPEGVVVPIIPSFLNLTLTFNKGIAFGLLSELTDLWRHLIINSGTVLALLMIVYFLKRHFKDDFIAHFAMALVVGGAIGNVIDRICYGQVVDFIDVYYKNIHWPAFNVADSAVCIGVFILLLKPTKHKV
ncbi:MAG: signal peptidase II [Bdellovibrionota bacterium]|jgi:signal peptidase II